MAPGAAAPSFPRLDKFIQIVDLDGRVVARSANLGTARLPTPAALLARLRDGEPVFETLPDFGDEPVRLVSLPLQLGTARLRDPGRRLPRRRPRRDAVRPAWLFLTMSLAILGAVVLTGAMLARAILRPIDRIVLPGAGHGGQRLAERLPHPGGRDEIGRLVETLNEMLARDRARLRGPAPLHRRRLARAALAALAAAGGARGDAPAAARAARVRGGAALVPGRGRASLAA